MSIAGIIAEYNPFHTGHAYQIDQTRALLGRDCGIVVVMSGNWTQQAGCAVADKWTRSQLALAGGADLVLELPTVWAVSSAESFAWGGISLLHACGVVEVLSFGSEDGDVDSLAQVARCLDSAAYPEALGRFLGQGLSFPAARQASVQELLGGQAQLLAHPNNNLGIEYLRSLNALNSPIRPATVLRKGAAHNALTEGAPFLSATQLRRYLAEGQRNKAEPFLPANTLSLLPDPMPSLAHLDRAMVARVRTMTAQDWSELPDSGAAEGLPQRLERAGQSCACMEEFYSLSKTKRYTHARLRRLALWAFLGLRAADRPANPPYLRVLGFRGRGQEILKEMKKKASLPILTKPAHVRELDEQAQRLFELECRCTDLYTLCLDPAGPASLEWTMNPVRLL